MDRAPAPRWLVVVALVSAAVGLVLRFVAEPGLWLDEALGVNVAQVPLGDLVDALRHDGHPPLYPMLLHGWIALVGDGDAAVRTLSGLAAALALPVAWLAGRRLAGPRAAWLAVALLGLSPFAIRYGTEARMYSVVQLLVALGVLLVAVALERPTFGVLAGLALTVAALVLTHYWALWLLLASVASLGVIWQRSVTHRSAVGRVVLAMGVGTLAFVPWLPVFLDQATSTGTPWGRTRNPLAVLGMTLNGFGGNLDVDSGARIFQGQLLGGALAAVLVLAVLGRGEPGGLVLRWPPASVPAGLGGVAVLTLGLGALGCLVTGTAFASRYASVVLVLVVLAIATGLASWPVPAVVVALALLLPLGLLGGLRAATEPRTQAPVLGALVNEGARAGDLVVVCPDQLGPALRREIDDAVRLVTYPDLGDPRFVDWRDYRQRQQGSDPRAVADAVLAAAGPGTVWYVWSGGYRRLDDRCERLGAALDEARPGEVVATADPDLLERATLVRFGAP